jgi:hypothetical protein
MPGAMASSCSLFGPPATGVGPRRVGCDNQTKQSSQFALKTFMPVARRV